MKKYFPVLLLLAALLPLAGCVRMAEPAAPVPAEMERLIEAAQSNAPEDGRAASAASGNPDRTLGERLGVPECLVWDYSSGDGRLRILSESAPIVLPDAVGLPVLRVQSAGFSQAQVDRLFDACCGDTPMYSSFSERDAYSRAELQGMIGALDRLMEYGPEDAEIRRSYRQDLEALLANAPDRAARTPDAPLLHTETLSYDDGALTGTRSYVALGALPEGSWRELTADEVRAFEQEK